METDKIMETAMDNIEDLVPATEEIMKAGSGTGFKVAGGFGLGILAGVAICKLSKPLIRKLKARKEPDVVEAEQWREEPFAEAGNDKEPDNSEN